MMQVFDKMTAPSTDGSFLVGKIEGFGYDNLVNVLGQPTFNEPSGDGKTQVEWVVKSDGEIFTIYDWKTYDRDFTLNELTTFHIGGTIERDLERRMEGILTVRVFIAELTKKLLRNEQAEII